MKAAESLLRMAVNKSYDLNAPGVIVPPKSMVEMLTDDPFKYSFNVKLQRRSSAVDINAKNHLIRKKSKHEQDKQKLMNPAFQHSIVEHMDGRERMLNYLDIAEARSRSISQSMHIRSSSYDMSKRLMQSQDGMRPLIGADQEARQQERSRKMSDMANHLRYQIAQRLLNLDINKQQEALFDEEVLYQA